jgi:hypothetical protein
MLVYSLLNPAGFLQQTQAASRRWLSTHIDPPLVGGVRLPPLAGLPPNNFVDCAEEAETKVTTLDNGVRVGSLEMAGAWCAVSGIVTHAQHLCTYVHAHIYKCSLRVRAYTHTQTHTTNLNIEAKHNQD